MIQSFLHELIFHQNMISKYWFDSILLFDRNSDLQFSLLYKSLRSGSCRDFPQNPQRALGNWLELLEYY